MTQLGVKISALATVLARRSGRSSALPYPPFERVNSTTLAVFRNWTVFQCESGWFFVVNFNLDFAEVVGFSLLKWSVFQLTKTFVDSVEPSYIARIPWCA